MNEVMLLKLPTPCDPLLTIGQPSESTSSMKATNNDPLEIQEIGVLHTFKFTHSLLDDVEQLTPEEYTLFLDSQSNPDIYFEVNVPIKIPKRYKTISTSKVIKKFPKALTETFNPIPFICDISLHDAQNILLHMDQWEHIITNNQNMVSLRCECECNRDYESIDGMIQSHHNSTLLADQRSVQICFDMSRDMSTVGGGQSPSTLVDSLRSFLPESFGSLQHLVILYFTNIPLITLPETVSGLVNLTTLILSRCFLDASFSESFCKIPNLKNIDIQYCNIESLPESISNLKCLEVLSINGGKISSLPETLYTLTKLKELTIDNNELSSLSDYISNLQNLSILSIMGNKIYSLPESIGKLVQLQNICISNNKIESLPDSFTNLTNLQSLSMSDCHISLLPESMGKLTNMVGLNIDNNLLTSLPESIGNMTNIESLYISNNRLTLLPESIGNLTKMKYFECSNNMLSVLPESIGNLIEISRLRIDGNHLTSLPDSISSLYNLRDIFLHNNRFQSLPESVMNLCLSTIDLTYNDFANIDFSKLNGMHLSCTLSMLDLSHSNIKVLPDSIGILSCLQRLDCSYNNMISIPETIDKLTRLRFLYLTHNSVSILPESVGNLKRLEILDCDYNQLTTLPTSINRLGKLAKLKCSHNRLTYLPIQLYYCIWLTRLFFSGNPIEFIPEPLIQKLYELNTGDYNRCQCYTEIYPLPESVITSINTLMDDQPVKLWCDGDGSIKIEHQRSTIPYTYQIPYDDFDQRAHLEAFDHDTSFKYACSDWSDMRIYTETSDDDLRQIIQNHQFITIDAREFIIQCIDMNDRHPIYRIKFKDLLKKVIQRIENGKVESQQKMITCCLRACPCNLLVIGDHPRRLIYTRLSEMMLLAHSCFEGFNTPPITLSTRDQSYSPLYLRLNELFTRLIDTLSPYYDDMSI
jgi:Leucine-rich repeat (LRR) protein